MKTLVVEKDKIRSNIGLIRQRCDNTPIIAVLKANGYGLGLLGLADIVRGEGITRFAVTEPEDALKLRNAGFTDEEILVLRSTAIPREISVILEAGATATIGSYDAAVALNGICEKNGTVIDAHIEIDTGMGRYGFLPNEFDKVLSVYQFMKNINVTGIYTHFNTAFASQKMTQAQMNRFLGVVDKIRKSGIEPGVVHAANSSALFKCDLAALDAVRIGSAITGRMPSKGKFNLKKAGYLESEIIESRWLPAGHSVGYGAAFITKKPTRIAVIPVGYSDGFMTEKSRDIYRFRDYLRYLWAETKKWLLGGHAYVTIKEHQARVLGHVGLAHTVVDVTKIECAVGDLARFEVSPLYVGGHVERRYV